MKVRVDGDSADIEIEDYGDLLAVRALPEWRMTAPRTVRTEARLLHVLDEAHALAPAEFGALSQYLFDFQRWIVDLALDRQRFAIFAMTGMGKTAMQLEWARLVTAEHKGRTLIMAPHSVVPQTIEESVHFYGDSLPITDLRDRSDLDNWLGSGAGIGITNYEKLDGITDALPVRAVVIDESSVLKSSMGARRTAIIAAFRGVRWKLACSATPAPNDRIEYAEHAYFLDVVRSTREFLASFFVNRDGQWLLKAHGADAFYRHLASWSVFIRSPEAYGFAPGAVVPPMSIEYPPIALTDAQATAARRWETGTQSSLFGAQPGGITSRIKMMQIAHGFELDADAGTVTRFESNKPDAIARIVNDDHGDEQVIVWVTFDEEGDALARICRDAVHISGKTKIPEREALINAFRRGEGPRVLLLKPRMFGFGLNLQTCRVQVFSTITDSWEQFFQAVRRSHRFGQTRPVKVYVPLTPLDEAMCQNVMNKQATYDADAERQEKAFVAVLRPSDTTEKRRLVTTPRALMDRTDGETWTMVQADCVAHMPTMAADSMDLAVFSPPFANLFTYSAEAADMGNVRGDEEYRLQWEFFVEQLFRVMAPGRVVAMHCMDVIRFAGQHGHRYTYDYPSDLRAGMERAGFRYHARIAIDKNPQIQATRTKDANLLFATLKRNALDSHPQASECVLVFRKPGESRAPVIADGISNVEWIQWAHHVWYGIRETDVLNAALGKEREDERHICPLQLSLIERCVRLWTNVGETVFSPFAGIGSEGWESIEWGRRFYGVELKRSYYEAACRFLGEKEADVSSRMSLFDDVAT